MENTVETEGYYIADLGVNIEAPKGANSNKLKMYANKLNITPEYKVAMSGQNIPFDEQLYNSTFSDIEVSDLSQTPRLDKKIYNRLAKQKYIEEGKSRAWGSTLLRSGWNQTVDIVEGAVGTAMDLPQDIGAAIAYATHSDELTPERREKWKDELADEALKKIRARKDKASGIKFDVNEYESKSAQSLGSLMPSTLTMGVLGMSTLLRTGNASKASSLLTLPSLFFGGSSAQEMKQKVLENGGSITDATLRAMMAGSTEYLLEKMGLKAFNKFYKRKHLGWVLGAGGVSEGLQETAQSGKDILVSGKYDKRNTGQKLDDIFDSAWYGFVGGLFFGAGGAKGTYYALSLKEQIYDAAVGVGKDHKTAIQIANAAVPSEGEIKEDLADFLNQELDNLPMATPEQMEKFKADYDEAVSVGGDEAESYIKAKDELKQKLVNAGVEDEKADKEARMFTGIVVNGYQAYKDTERALGREPTKGFDEVKEEFYKLNSVINHSIDDTNEMWADYDSRNQTEFNEEQDIVEGKPSRKLYSRIGYATMRNPLEGNALSTTHYGEGESGHTLHGHGNYLLFDRAINERNYYDRWSGITKRHYIDGEPVKGDILDIINKDKTKQEILSEIADINKELDETIKEKEDKLKELPNIKSFVGREFTSEEDKKTVIDFMKNDLEHDIDVLLEQKEINEKRKEKINNFKESDVETKVYYPKMRYKGENVSQYGNTFGNFLWKIAEDSNSQEELDKEAAEYKELLQEKIIDVERDVNRLEKKLTKEEVEKANNIVSKANSVGDLFEGDEASLSLFANSTNYLDYKNLVFHLNSLKKQLKDINSYGEIKIEDVEKYTDVQQWSVEAPDVDVLLQEDKPFKKQSQYVQEALLNLHRDLQFPIREQKNFTNIEEAESFFKKENERFAKNGDGMERFRPKIIDNSDGSITISYVPKYDFLNLLNEVGDNEGGAIYRVLSDYLGSKEAASNKLLEYGIKGIDYWGYTDGHGAVIFEDVPVVERMLSQAEGDILGSYDPYTREVELFKGQNPSTLTHELGHHFLLSHLRLMESMGLKDRNAPVFEWLSKVVGRDINSVADMEELDTDEINPHEALVEAFISYMNNGEAPNLVTENIFKRAKNWLLDRFRVHKTEASTEIRDYFDSIIARDETIPDMSGLTTRTREIAEILKQAKNGEQVSFKGLGKKELKELQKAFHSIVRRKGRSLRDMIIERGGIKEGTELAKSLGFDVLKKDKMYTTKDTAFDNEAELIDWLAEEGLIVGVQEGEDYSATERRWEDVQRLIDNAENTYTVKESLINQERETALANKAHVQEIVDELLKDNDLGLKDINDLDDLLRKIVSRKDDVDITKVNSNAIKYLNERVKGLNKEIKALERNKNKEFKNKREEQYLAQNDLKDFIRGLPINNQHKVALMGNIQRVKDYDSLAQIVNDLKPRIKGYIEQEAKFLLSKNIDTLIKRSKPKKVTKQFSTYTYNKLFEELRDIYKLSQKQAQHQVMGINLKQEEDFDNSLAGRLKRSLLFYKAEGMGSSLIAMKTLYDNLNTIYNEAVNAGLEAEMQKGEARAEAINEVIDYVNTHEPAKNFISRMFNKDKKSDDVYVKNTDFYGLSSALFGKKWADEHQMLTVLNDVLEKVANRQDNAYAVARKIYNAKSQADLLNILAEKNKVIDSITANDGSFYELSISDIMDIYNGMKNEKTKRLFLENYEDFDEEGNQITNRLGDLLKNLSDEDKAYADFMQKDLEQNYDELNKLYVKLYGIDMKKEENYWARTSEKPDPFYDLKDAKGFSPLSTIASQMKERATTVKPVPSNAIAKYNKGVSDYYYMTTAFEKFKDIYDVVTSKYVKVAIQGKYDSNVYEALADHLRAMSLSGNQIHLSDIDNKANQVVANIVGSKIALNVNVFFKQLISITNYSENMPVVEFSKNLVEGIMHPKETIKYMNDIAGSFLSTRMKGGLQSEAVARFIKESQSLNSKWFKAGTKYNWTEFMGTLVKYGDIIPIYFGGYARVKYLMDNGATKQEALDKFKFETLQTQQAANAAALAGYQRSKNPAARLFSAFLNAPAQYMRKLYNADIQYRRGEITHEQFIKTVMNYGVVQPAIYIMLSNILRGLWNDDDDTPFYEGLVSYLVTSPFQGIPLAGSILQNVGTAIEKRIADKYVANDVVGVLFVDDINRAWRKANKKDIEFLDWFDIITPIIEPLVQAPITSVKQVARAIDSRL